ncbi:aspm-1, partial [Pristionchus pacificus]
RSMENPPTPSRKAPAFRRPAIVLDESEKNSDSSSDAPDGAFFRQPLAPIQMSISPGNAANDVKLADKLRKLELSRKKTTRSQLIDLKTPSKVDLVATEKFFVESSVENIPQTPRNQRFRQPFHTPAQLTHNGPSMDFRDSIRSNATYVLTTPRMDRALYPHNDPFTPMTPSRRPATVSTPLAYEEKLERQFVALSSWANVILDSASFVSEIDLGTSKQDASRKLQEMLTKTNKKSNIMNEGKTGKYTDMCLRKKCLDYLKRADSVYQSIQIPNELKKMVEKGNISIKPNIEVYANIGVQTSILSLLFTLHPFWLFIAVETVCAEFNDHDTVSLDARLPFSSSSFAPATVRFIHDHILANAKLMSKKKFAIGTVKKIVTDKGREMLHNHCITCILSMAVLLEYAKNSYLFENTPGLFVKNSEIKTVNDFCMELSRLVLSASGTPLNKAFDKVCFSRSYRQSFLEEYHYVMQSVRDMADGIILGRLIELLTDSSPLSIIGNMRNPQGDRIRKKGNVEKALMAASEAGIDVDGISIDQILSAHRESCLDLMWRLVGVYVRKRAEQEPLRRESLCLDNATDTDEADETVMGAPLGGMAESAFTVYQQLAFQFGMHLSKWADLENGLLLSSIWQHYNPTAPDVRFYNGESLFDKVAHAADSDLGIPLALTALRDERQLGLFAHMFLSRLISYKRLRDSEMSDGDSDASSIVSIIRKEGVNLSEETERIQQRVRLESEKAISAKEEEEKRREEDLRRRFEEEEQEREEEARLEAERVRKQEEESRVEEVRLREEDERRRIEEEERERMMREKEEEEERITREEEARLEMERLRMEEEERIRLIEVARVKAEEEERMRIIEKARLKAEEDERMRREEEERQRIIEEARLKALEEERLRREEERRMIEDARLRAEEEERRERAALKIQCWIRSVFAVRMLNGMKKELEERLRWEEEERMKRDREEERRWRAALIIQTWIRGVYAVRLAHRLVAMREEERMRRERAEEERREKAALTIQCWIRQVYALRVAIRLWTEREVKRQEEAKRDGAARKITSWICDRLTIRAAKKELEERRMKRNEERERMRIEEEERRKKAVGTIEQWFSSILSIRAARSLLISLRERAEEERRERERLEIEERERQEEEARRLYVKQDTAATKIQEFYRGYRLMVEAKRELYRMKERHCLEDLAQMRMRMLRSEEERIRMEEDERIRMEEEERIRGEEQILEMERFRREEEEKRLRDEEEARLEIERQLREEEEERLRREEEERERQLREDNERLRREEAVKIEKERIQKEKERRREEEELREWGLRQQLARQNEERLYQEMLAENERTRRLDEMRENRAVKVIQSSIRSWLHKKRMEKRTIQLLQSMEGTTRNTNGRQTISGFSDDRLAAGVREIKRRQRKLSLTLYRMPRFSTAQAATRIQAWWRGIRTRRNHRVEMELIGVRMREYNQRAERIMDGDRERSVPVSKRLANAKKHLENPQRLYDIKVACYTTMCLCRLSSLYCERAIVLDLPTLLIDCFTIQADRSPAFEEIIEFGVQAIEEMVKCTSERVRSAMITLGGDVVRIAAHQMMAFHNNTTISPSAMKILRSCKEILPVESHEKTFEKIYSYYFKKGEEKFGKLAPNDIRHIEFVELKKTFSK